MIKIVFSRACATEVNVVGRRWYCPLRTAFWGSGEHFRCYGGG